AAFDHAQRLAEVLPLDLLLEGRSFALTQGDDDLADRVALSELAQRMHQDRRALQFEKLLALALQTAVRGGHARAEPRGRNDDNDLHVGEASITVSSFKSESWRIALTTETRRTRKFL